MSSGNKLNQSLDEIMMDSRKTIMPRRGRTTRRVSGKATANPVGGVQKNTRASKGTERLRVSNGPPKSGDGKIVVSNLPHDVTETQVKDYFHSTIGPVKKAVLTYGPNGQSRGSATIVFVKHESAVKAAKDLDGVKIDKRPMKIELIIAAKEMPAPAPPKSLGERIAKPKPATKDRAKTGSAAAGQKSVGKVAGARGRAVVKRGRNAGRPKAKTAQQLDAEMQDYFGTESSGNGDVNMGVNGGAVQAVTNGEAVMEAVMEDEIL